MATKFTTLPASWSNKDEKERLREDAAASLSRMLNRAVADTGVNFQLWDALRSKADQERLFLRAYTRTNRGRTKSTDRSYQGAIWALKAGHLPVASPDYVGGSVGTHRQGRAIDIHPTAIQDWIKANGRAYGWTWDTGRRVGEDHHFEYEADLDTMKAEGPLDHGWVQKVVGAKVDHKIGTGTVAKIKAWQKAHGLTADGKVGRKTKAAMLGEAAADAAEDTTDDVSGPALQPAANGIFPWADATTQFWDAKYPGQTYQGGHPIGLLHTTETGTWPGYGAGASAPHLTVLFDPGTKTAQARQHFSATRPARALVNKTGGVQTNNARVFQIELIGSCDRAFASKHGYPYLPDLLAEAWARDALAGILAAVSKSLDIPLSTSVTWAPYPGSYGETADQRLTGAQWTAYTGWLGHQHAPENTHGDPGNIPAAAILDAARGGAPAPVVPPTAPQSPPTTLPTGKALLVALIAAPDFPLLRTAEHRCYYGHASGPLESVSGHKDNRLAPGDLEGKGSTGLRAWQGQMNARGYSLTEDGLYGDQSEKAARNLQRLAGITQDGKIGPDCWYAAWILPVVK